MKFLIEGELTAYLRFLRAGQITLPLGPGATFQLPASLSRGIVHSFRLEIEATDEGDASTRATETLESISCLLSYHFNTPVQDTRISRVAPVAGGPATVIATFSSGGTVVGEVRDPDATSFSSRYRALEDAANPRSWTVLELYRDARATADGFRKFWLFYSILLILVPPKAKRSDRMAIDKYIRKNHTTVPIYRNDNPEFGEVTLTVAIRDSFSHAKSTYNGGNRLDLKQAIDSHIEELHGIVRDAIRDRL
jgi:hypothetical protein